MTNAFARSILGLQNANPRFHAWAGDVLFGAKWSSSCWDLSAYVYNLFHSNRVRPRPFFRIAKRFLAS